MWPLRVLCHDVYIYDLVGVIHDFGFKTFSSFFYLVLGLIFGFFNSLLYTYSFFRFPCSITKSKLTLFSKSLVLIYYLIVMVLRQPFSQVSVYILPHYSCSCQHFFKLFSLFFFLFSLYLRNALPRCNNLFDIWH